MTTKPITAVEWTLARQYARRCTVEEIKRQGYLLTSTSAREISAAANLYLGDHNAECLAHAQRVIAGSAVLQKMIERQERDRARRAKLTTAAPRWQRWLVLAARRSLGHRRPWQSPYDRFGS